MGLLGILGACVIAETIGNKVQSIAEESHAAERDKAKANKEIVKMQETTKRENARLRAEIAKMKEETARSNARLREETERTNARLRAEAESANAKIRAEAKVAAERIRASGMVATASIMYGKDSFGNMGNTVYPSDYVQNRNVNMLPRNNGPAGYIPENTFIQESSDPKPRFCEKCGSKLIPGSFFCRNCGNRIR